jgi:argininosuccinate lyase
VATDPSGNVRLWGGGFATAIHPALCEISYSVAQDMPLAAVDCTASATWTLALGDAGLLETAEATQIAATLAPCVPTWTRDAGFPPAQRTLTPPVARRLPAAREARS